MTEPFDFGPILDATISRFTVAFVHVEGGTPKPLGSGTLVKCASVQGILTCAHVLREIQKVREIGICVFPARKIAVQQTKVDVGLVYPGAVEIYDEERPGEGKDLGFLPLPVPLLTSLKAKASELDLELHAGRARASRPDNSEPVEAVAGMVGKMTPPAVIRDGKLVLCVEGLINIGKFIETTTRDGFDYIRLEPVPASQFELPDHYGGTSGGGMWRVYVRKQPDGSYTAVETRLVGVVFSQSPAPNRTLLGHGPVSIYGHLVAEMKRRWR
jgi:hypothetical protein